MALAMQAAAKKKIPFVVLDRPNPIGGEIVEGALLDPKFKSFVGMYPIPARHGMTVGELATLFNQKYGIGAELIVVRVANWRRSQWLDETGLPWVNPSPNLRSLAALRAIRDRCTSKAPTSPRAGARTVRSSRSARHGSTRRRSRGR